MEQNRPVLVVSEETQKLPLLIVDKKGVIGGALAKKLQEEFLVVLVSGHPTGEELIHKNIVHIPYRKRIPLIPDNTYSHMFLVYNGEREIIDMLPAFVHKARQSHAKLFFITSLFYGTTQLYAHLNHHAYHDVQVLIFGEVFDNNLTEANDINFFVHQARVYGRLEIANSGMNRVYPVAFEDVLSAIIAAAFAAARKYKFLLIFPHHPTTEVSVARIFQKIDPFIKVDFIKKKKKTTNFTFPADGVYFFANYDLEEKIRALDLSRKTTTPAVPQNKIKLVLPKTKAPNPFATSLGILVFLVLFPIISTFILAFSGASILDSAVKDAEKMKFGSARSQAALARTSFAMANTMSTGLLLIDIPFHEQKEKLVQNIQTGEEVAQMTLEVLAATEKIQGIYNGKSNDPKNDFLHATATIKNAFLTLQQLQAEKRLPANILARLEKFRDAVEISENTIDIWPSLLGFDGKRTYLVLFQNNMELRPGGGFIGSYGLLTLENGKSEKFHIYDVYDADGQLKGHVEPPYALRRYLGASHWYLRDSNFDIDFTRSAVEAARFLKLETGDTVDGVIAVDTTFLQNILKALKSVHVQDYNETVTPDNFYMLTQTHAEKDFFPGSTQKKDFLKALSNAMLLKLSEEKNISYQEILQQTVLSIKQKHVLFAFGDQVAQNVFTINGLTSSMWDGRRGDDNAFLDFLGIVDANVGTNKVNFYLKRSWEQAAEIDENGNFTAKTTVTYENTSKKDSPFGGNYKNYVRFILPANASLQSVTIDGRELTAIPAVTDPAIFTQKDFIPPSGLEIERSEQKGKTIIGFFHIVPASSSQTISLTYAVARAVDLQRPSFVYDLQLFKQPGTQDEPYSVSFAYPGAFKLVSTDDKARDIGGKVVDSSNLLRDTRILMEFSRR